MAKIVGAQGNKTLVALTVRVEEELYQNFKMLLIKDKSNVQSFLSSAINTYVKKGIKLE